MERKKFKIKCEKSGNGYSTELVTCTILVTRHSIGLTSVQDSKLDIVQGTPLDIVQDLPLNIVQD